MAKEIPNTAVQIQTSLYWDLHSFTANISLTIINIHKIKDLNSKVFFNLFYC